MGPKTRIKVWGKSKINYRDYRVHIRASIGALVGILVTGYVTEAALGMGTGLPLLIAPMDAETLLGQILSSTDESDIKEEKVKELINESDSDIMLAFISNIISKNVKDNLDLIEKIKDLNISFEDFTLDLIEFFRKILVYKYNQDVMERWSNLENDLKEKIISLSKTIDFNYLDKIIRKLIDVRLDMAKSSIIELPLQLAIIELVEDENNKKIDNKVNIDDIDEILENSTIDKKNEKKEKEEILDLEKRERLLQKFGIKKADSKQVKEGGETSVLDLIQEEFKNEIIN